MIEFEERISISTEIEKKTQNSQKKRGGER
uniref:Uncharacterized protein n=1 Tax=Rhizophora mucronata TaxID=61149 RepID=A0A2P2R0A4_RHIMU